MTKQKLLGMLTMSLATFIAFPALAQTPSASISVKAVHHGGQVRYSYSVTNTGTTPIGHFWIGGATGGNAPLILSLTSTPRPLAGSLILSSEGTTTPAGWAAIIITADGEPAFAVDFTDLQDYQRRMPGWKPQGGEPKPASSASYIAPGETRTGFELTVPSIDVEYFRNATVFSDKDVPAVVSVQNADKQAPAVSLQGKVHHAGEHIVVETKLTVTDNVDPSPEHVVSLSRCDAATGANVEQLTPPKHLQEFRVPAIPGKAYTLTVTALDASGNAGVGRFGWNTPARPAESPRK